MLGLERQSAAAAHWTELQYQVALRTDESGSGRLVLVVDQDAEGMIPSEQKGTTELLAFLVAHYLGPEWELENILGSPARTVRVAFNNKTPCFAHGDKHPSLEAEIPRSFSSSKKMFFSEGGKGIPQGTLKLNTWACPGPW